MNFVPKFLPISEALRIVGERSNIKTGQRNPLWLALDESAIVPELRRNGEWKKASPEECKNLSVWFPNHYHAGPSSGQISHSDVQFETSEIDKLWPSEVQRQRSDMPAYISPFLEMMLKATEHFKISASTAPAKKHTIEEYFKKQKLPDGKPVSPSQASMMATFVRPPEAMKGGQKKVG